MASTVTTTTVEPNIQKRVSTLTGAVKYAAYYRDPNGCRRTKTFVKLAQARSFLTTTKSALLMDEWVDPTLARMTLNRYRDEKYDAGRSTKSNTQEFNRTIWQRHCGPTIGERRLDRIDREGVVRWIQDDVIAKHEFSVSYLRHIYREVTRTLDNAAANGYIRRNPSPSPSAAGVPRESSSHGEMRLLSVEEVNALAGAFDPRYRSMILTGAFTGLRPGELYGLAWKDVDLDRRLLRVTQAVSEDRGKRTLGEVKKRASLRRLRISADLATELQRHRETWTNDLGLLWTTSTGNLIARGSYRQNFIVPAVEKSIGNRFFSQVPRQAEKLGGQASEQPIHATGGRPIRRSQNA